jgi:hypothetical protein
MEEREKEKKILKNVLRRVEMRGCPKSRVTRLGGFFAYWVVAYFG